MIYIHNKGKTEILKRIMYYMSLNQQFVKEEEACLNMRKIDKQHQ